MVRSGYFMMDYFIGAIVLWTCCVLLRQKSPPTDNSERKWSFFDSAMAFQGKNSISVLIDSSSQNVDILLIYSHGLD